MRERVAGGGELLEEAAGDRDVDAAEVRGERLDLGTLRTRLHRSEHHIWDFGLARTRFFRKNQRGRDRGLRVRGHARERGAQALQEGPRPGAARARANVP